jgi:uncharacterized membrane protein HdeD (DUF308 family)
MIVIARSWWTFVLRGIFAILFGVLAFLMPGVAWLTMVFVFGFYAIADGVVNLVAAFGGPRPPGERRTPGWALFIQGLLGIIAGCLAFFIPGLTALALLWLIGGWAIATGVLAIVTAIRLRKQITGEWLMVLSGVLSIVFGVLLFAFPIAGAVVVAIWIGAYAVVFGVTLVALGIRLRKWIRGIEGQGERQGGGRGFPPTVAPSH